MNLTADVVKGLGATDRPKTFYDSKLTGFGLCCRPPSTRSPEGSASWIYEYRPGGGRRNPTRRVKLGSYPEIEIADARKLAKAAIKAVLNGEDPAETRREARDALTIRELADRYQTEAAPGRKAGTRVLYETYWRLHILPELGSMKARDVKRSDVAKLHRTIGAKYQITANRCITVLRHFYNWAAKVGEVPEGFNPATAVSRYREAAKERYLSPEELERLAKAITEAETIGIPWREPKGKPSKHRPRRAENRRSKITSHAAAAIRLLLLTGARLREILHLKWEHVDLGRGLLLLPDSKSGKKTIVLSGAALQIIAGLDKVGDYVIASTDPEKPRSDLNRPWGMVCRRAGLTGVRLHDLRHTYASFGASGGLGLPIIGGLLGHANTSTTARYAHLANDPMRRAADLIAGGIEAAMRGGERADG